MSMRDEFEKWVSGPPYEKPVDRFPDLDDKESWPGQYRAIDVQLAWETWQKAARASEDEQYPDCDTCGKAMDYMPWHYSKGEERHLHACDQCWPRVNPRAGAVPEGYALIPESMALSYEDIENIMTMTGWDEGRDDFGEGVLWVGAIKDDDGNETWGLNISCVEVMEEGALPAHEFDRPVLTAAPTAPVEGEPLFWWDGDMSELSCAFEPKQTAYHTIPLYEHPGSKSIQRLEDQIVTKDNYIGFLHAQVRELKAKATRPQNGEQGGEWIGWIDPDDLDELDDRFPILVKPAESQMETLRVSIRPQPPKPKEGGS